MHSLSPSIFQGHMRQTGNKFEINFTDSVAPEVLMLIITTCSLWNQVLLIRSFFFCYFILLLFLLSDIFSTLCHVILKINFHFISFHFFFLFVRAHSANIKKNYKGKKKTTERTKNKWSSFFSSLNWRCISN